MKTTSCYFYYLLLFLLSGGAEKSTQISGSHAKNFFCSMYEMSQRHPVWVAENHVNPCNSVAAYVFVPSVFGENIPTAEIGMISAGT
jgi:hypothetical protein